VWRTHRRIHACRAQRRAKLFRRKKEKKKSAIIMRTSPSVVPKWSKTRCVEKGKKKKKKKRKNLAQRGPEVVEDEVWADFRHGFLGLF
jgi:hypothetical protein